MDRRSLLLGTSGLVGASLAGCVTVGGEPNEHLAWSTSLGVSPDPGDARDLAVVGDALAAVTADRIFGVGRSEAVRWESFEHPSAVFGTDEGFLGVDWPGYHPRNAVNEAVLTGVSPDGTVRWRSGRFRLRDLAVGAERVVALHDRTSEVALSAVSVADGTTRWTVRVDPSTHSVRSTAGAVIAVGDVTVAYDPRTGRRAWTGRALEGSWPPAIDGSRLYLTAETGPYRVLVLDVADGHTVGEYRIGDGLVPTAPLVVRDGVGLGTAYDGDESPFFAVDPATGDVRWWRVPDDDVVLAESPRSAGAFLDGTAFLFSYKYVLRAVDLRDGSVGWTFDVEKAYPVVAAGDDTVYVLAGGTVHALDPTA